MVVGVSFDVVVLCFVLFMLFILFGVFIVGKWMMYSGCYKFFMLGGVCVVLFVVVLLGLLDLYSVLVLILVMIVFGLVIGV